MTTPAIVGVAGGQSTPPFLPDTDVHMSATSLNPHPEPAKKTGKSGFFEALLHKATPNHINSNISININGNTNSKISSNITVSNKRARIACSADESIDLIAETDDGVSASVSSSSNSSPTLSKDTTASSSAMQSTAVSSSVTPAASANTQPSVSSSVSPAAGPTAIAVSPEHSDTRQLSTAVQHQQSSNTNVPTAKYVGPPIPNDYVPLYVGSRTLKDAGVNDTRDGALFVQLQVSSTFPDCPQTVDYLQYSYNSASKLKFAASFLGSKAGLGIVAPTVPAYIALSSAEQHNIGCQNIDMLWLAQLDRQINQYGKIITDPEGDGNAKLSACVELNHLLEKARTPYTENGKQHQPVFGGHCVSEWKDLLTQPSQIIRSRSSRTRETAITMTPIQNKHHTYQLALYTVSPYVAYIIACTMHEYAMIKDIDSGVTTKMATTLSGQIGSQTSSTDSTDEDEQEWETHHSHRNKRRANPKQQLKETQAKIHAIASTPAYVAALPQYLVITQAPLLALAVNVKTRALRHKYISCVIDNFQSIGCDISNLARDPIFAKVKSCRAEFDAPYARWSVTQRLGNSSASLFIREDHKDVIANLNEYVRNAVHPQQQPALRVAMTVARRNKDGRGVDHSTCTKIYLTSPTKVLPPQNQRRTSSAPPLSSAYQPATENTYAARLAEGLRRRAASTGLPSRSSADTASAVPSAASAPTPHMQTVKSSISSSVSSALPATQASPSPWARRATPLIASTLTPPLASTGTAGIPETAPSRMGQMTVPASLMNTGNQLSKLQIQTTQQMEGMMALMIEQQMKPMMDRMLNNMLEQMIQRMIPTIMNAMMQQMQQMMASMAPSMMQSMLFGQPQPLAHPSQQMCGAVPAIPNTVESHPVLSSMRPPMNIQLDPQLTVTNYNPSMMSGTASTPVDGATYGSYSASAGAALNASVSSNGS